MKKFQRLNAFFLALALLVSLLPMGVFSMQSSATVEAPAVEVGKTYLHAVYLEGGAEVDGAADNTYPLTVALSDSVMLGAAWDATYLYLSVNSAAELAELKLNDVDITEKQVTAAAGEDPGYAEYRIALMDADVASLDAGAATVTVKLDDSAAEQTVYLIFDNNVYSAYELEVSGSLAALVEGNPYAADVKGTKAENSYVTADGSALVPSLDAPVIVEMDIDINALIGTYNLTQNVNANVRYVTMGAGVQVMDELVTLNSSNIPTEAFLFGFSKDKVSGHLYFQSAVSTGVGSFTSSDVLISETVGGLYHVRVEYTYAPDANGELSHDSVVSAKYFINGQLIDEQDDVRVSKTGKAMVGSTKGVRLYSSKAQNDYTVSNISISGNAPAALAALKAAYVAGRQGPDQAAAALVATQINSLPAVSQLSLTNKAAVEEARAAYEDLTPAQKAYVEETTLNTLAAAEAKIASLFVQSRNDYLFADAVGGIVLDGQIESSYRLNIPFTPTTRMGAVWDLTNLYLAITGDDLGEMTAVAVDGKPLTAVKGAGGNEYAIPVGALRLNGDTFYDLTFTLDGITWSGKVILSTDDYATIKMNASTNATVDADLLNRVAYLNTTENKGQAITTVTNCYKAEGITAAPTIFECDIKFNEIPDNGKLSGYSRAFCQGGIGIVFRDQDTSSVEGTTNLCEAFLIGIFKQNGVMKLGFWDNAANNGEGAYVIKDAGEAVDGQYHIRAEFTYSENVLSNDIAAKYYVNGCMVGQATSAKQSGGSKGTGSPLGVSFDAYNNGQGRVDAVVSNVSVSHPKGMETATRKLEQSVPATHTNILLQPGANKSEMNFTWFSLSQEDGVIQYAKESELVNGRLPGNAATVTATRGTYDKKVGYVNNKATITGLEADTVYYYQLINGSDMTELKSFKTGKDGDFSFAFVGDPQIGGSGDGDKLNSDLITQHLKEEAEWWGMTLEQIKAMGVDFLMSAGDQTDTHAYNFWDKKDVEGIFAIHEQQFDAFSNQDVLLGLPIVTVTGNHDDDTYPVYTDHVNVPKMLINPETGTYYGATYTGGTNFTGADYYFTYNNVLFLVLNANTYYHDRTNSDEHLEFVDRVINVETAGQNFDWIITLYHESPYGSSYHRDESRDEAEIYAKIRSHLVPKLYEAGVDLVLSGHDHCYTRTHILKPGKDGNDAYNDSYVIQDGAYNEWKNGVPIGAANVDGMLHVVGGTGSGSQVNAVKPENIKPEMVTTATANIRMMTKIEITDDTLTLITYNLGSGMSNNPVEIDRISITNDGDAEVESAIDAIGNVTFSSEAKITAARAAYDALSPQLKKRVANYQTLVDAEAAFEALPEEEHHTMTPVAGKTATCAEDGYAAYQWCEHCATYFTVEGAEIADIDAWKTGEGKLPATGEHVYANVIARTEATCVATGSVTKACACGAQTTETLPIDKNAHTGNNTVEGKLDATCDEAGFTGNTVCECGTVIEEGVVIDATGNHNYVDGACDVCGKPDPDSVTVEIQGPADQEAAIGETVTFSVVVNSDNATYRWYFRAAGAAEWHASALPGFDTDTLSVEVKDYRDGLQLMCVVTVGGKSFDSEIATLTVESGEIVVNSQPVDVNDAVLGKTSQFTVDAATLGGENISYQWYVYNVSKGEWERSYLEGCNTATLTVSVTRFRVGLQYKCVITSGLNEVETDVVTLNMQQIVMEKQNAQFADKIGGNAVLSVNATGNDLKYQWYFSNDGVTWKVSGLTGNKTNELTVKTLAYRVGQSYRCKITDVNGQVTWSDPVALTVG